MRERTAAPDRAAIHRIIDDELVKARRVAAGAEAIILGCTEIMLPVGPEDSPVPRYDTAGLHAAAVDLALA